MKKNTALNLRNTILGMTGTINEIGNNLLEIKEVQQLLSKNGDCIAAGVLPNNLIFIMRHKDTHNLNASRLMLKYKVLDTDEKILQRHESMDCEDFLETNIVVTDIKYVIN